MKLLWILILIIVGLSKANPIWDFDTLPLSTNITEAIKLDNLLESYHYTHPYIKNVFDCSDMSIICQHFLNTNSYKAITMRNDPDNLVGHMWVAVKFVDGYLFVETTANWQTELGAIVWGDDINDYETGIVIDDPLLYNAAMDPIHTQKSYGIEENIIEK
jgi:hypothetical protein